VAEAGGLMSVAGSSRPLVSGLQAADDSTPVGDVSNPSLLQYAAACTLVQ